MKNFALTGAAGYIAPRHMKAIKDTGNELVAAIDPHDAVGIIDSYFPQAAFFTEYERFDRHIEKLRRKGDAEQVHFVSICSPNYLHDAHIRTALRAGADAICEKPLVLNPWNIEALAELEQETGRRVYNVLQLRVHDTIRQLKEKYAAMPNNTKHDITLTYITSRGQWYLRSWKGAVDRSGGLASNIGVHFYDMLMWIFGKVQHSEVHLATPMATSGFLELERARVRWFLSVDYNDIPQDVRERGQRTFRSIRVDGDELEFSEGFTDLHTVVYRDILSGGGYGLEDALPSIEVVYGIRNATPVVHRDMIHDFVHKKLSQGAL